jgi:hypothetical protein
LDKVLNLSEKLGIAPWVSDLGGIALFALIIATVVFFTLKKKKAQQ